MTQTQHHTNGRGHAPTPAFATAGAVPYDDPMSKVLGLDAKTSVLAAWFGFTSAGTVLLVWVMGLALLLACRPARSVGTGGSSAASRFHTVKDAGVLAPARTWRARIAPKCAPAEAEEPTKEGEPKEAELRARHPVGVGVVGERLDGGGWNVVREVAPRSPSPRRAPRYGRLLRRRRAPSSCPCRARPGAARARSGVAV